MLCPCGSDQVFTQCCQAIIAGNITAKSPEQLMRSRYCAYATNQSEYIFLTYAKISRKTQSLKDITQWANETKWLKLVIHHTSDFQSGLIVNSNTQAKAQVEFSAFYLHQGQLWEMKEESNFIIENNSWRYLDGNVSKSTKINKPKRNELCFCDSSKKFKQCCAKVF